MNRIPESYESATWRNTLPVDNEEIGVGFNVGDRVIRLRLDLKSAKHLSETIVEYIQKL
jgi:hypothetical protein